MDDQLSQIRSAGTAPNVEAHGARNRLASFGNKPVKTPGMAAFGSNVRHEAYAPRRLSSAEPQALQMLLEAFLAHHGNQ